jgi:hypothetical protein
VRIGPQTNRIDWRDTCRATQSPSAYCFAVTKVISLTLLAGVP